MEDTVTQSPSSPICQPKRARRARMMHASSDEEGRETSIVPARYSPVSPPAARYSAVSPPVPMSCDTPTRFKLNRYNRFKSSSDESSETLHCSIDGCKCHESDAGVTPCNSPSQISVVSSTSDEGVDEDCGEVTSDGSREEFVEEDYTDCEEDGEGNDDGTGEMVEDDEDGEGTILITDSSSNTSSEASSDEPRVEGV
jgi:hypothetical protein